MSKRPVTVIVASTHQTALQFFTPLKKKALSRECLTISSLQMRLKAAFNLAKK